MHTLILLSLLGCSFEEPEPAIGATEAPAASRRSDVDVGTFATAHASGARVVDVRTPDEYAGGHVPGAVNLPLDALDPADPALVGMGKDEPIYVICASGGRSSRAADVLADAGYTAVNVEGGTNGWVAAGNPVEP